MQRFFHFFLMFLGALLFISGGAWFADFVREIVILQEQTDEWLWALDWGWWVGGSLVLFMLGAAIIYFAGKELMEFKPRVQREDAKPHRVLVLLVSTPSSREKPDAQKNIDHAIEQCSENIDQDIEKPPLPSWPWTHMLRGIKQHRDALEKVILVGSKDSPKKEDGTHRYVEACSHWLHRYLPEPEVEIKPYSGQAPDFELLDQMQNVAHRVIKEMKEAGFKEDDIIFDVTGGQKTASIGMAFGTLPYPGVDFQYVTNSGEVVAYNLVGVNYRSLA